MFSGRPQFQRDPGRYTPPALFLAVAATLACFPSCSFRMTGLSDQQWQPQGSDVTDQDSVVSLEDASYVDSVWASDSAASDPGGADAPAQDAASQDATSDYNEFPLACTSHWECDDGVECTLDRCLHGSCSHSPQDGACPQAPQCWTHTCDLLQGCLLIPNEGGECSITDDKCVEKSVCTDSGKCVPSVYVQCKSMPCMESNCMPETGECSYLPLTGQSCDDGNPCTGDDKCLDGSCTGQMSRNACSCTYDQDCADVGKGNLCQGKFVCQEGFCVVEPGSAVACPEVPEGLCYHWKCEPATGSCIKEFSPIGTPCSDDNPCTQEDQCESGQCVGVAQSNGAPCDLDFNPCTLDYCSAAICEAGPPMSCEIEDPCLSSFCDATSGKCVVKPDSGAECDDGDPCTAGDHCLFGQCVGAFDSCVDCTLAVNGGHPCDDGDGQTVGDHCRGGLCAGFVGIPQPEGGVAAAMSALGKDQSSIYSLGTLPVTETNALFEYSFQGSLTKTVSLGADNLMDISGNVAVGKPGLVYVKGLNWTGNNALRGALSDACPGFGTALKPVSVVALGAGAPAQLTGSTGPASVLVGFESTAATYQPACLLVWCTLQTEPLSWNCSPIPLESTSLGDLQDSSMVRIAAMDAHISQCSGSESSCDHTINGLVAYEVQKPGGQEWGLVELAGPSAQQGWAVTQLHSQTLPTATGVGPRGPAALSLLADGRFAVVGYSGLLYVRQEPQGPVKSVELPPMFPDAILNLSAVSLDPEVSTIALNVLRKPFGANDPGSITMVVLTGPGLWPLASPVQSAPFLIQLGAFDGCPACVEPADWALGIRDLLLVESVGADGLSIKRLVLALSSRVGDALSGGILFSNH